MTEHEIDIVETQELNMFKGEEVRFPAVYKYCSNTDQYSESENMMNKNTLAMKDAYREKVGLLTSYEIKNIRKKYGVTQADFANILGMGKKTITRYENHQIQDKTYDKVLRKINDDPRWFLDMVKNSKDDLREKSYEKYLKIGKKEFKKKENKYLIETIEAKYAEFSSNENGNRELNLNKVVEMVNYLANNIRNLYKVKLMKLLWYTDSIYFKMNNKSMSGLVYKAFKMGAVPEAYQEILELKGIKYDVEFINGYESYHFLVDQNFKIEELSSDEIEVLDKVIDKYGELDTQILIKEMHEEEAYKCTNKNCIIDYSHSKKIEI
jgi:putative zinc finger/helix-turn-helix YgiT family protein